MSTTSDFQRTWLAKLSTCLDAVTDPETRDHILSGSESLSDESSSPETIAWTQTAMARIDSLLDDSQKRAVMTGCACRYPIADLAEIRDCYAGARDLDLAHGMLLAQFDSFLRDSLRLPDDVADEVLRRGWGVAGIRDGDTIIATKIPKSDNLAAYLSESDPGAQREFYCHCPRIREILATGEALSPTYCYCGAGFYKGIWEEILQQPVEVEVLKTLLAGDDVCQFAIHLPSP